MKNYTLDYPFLHATQKNLTTYEIKSPNKQSGFKLPVLRSLQRLPQVILANYIAVLYYMDRGKEKTYYFNCLQSLRSFWSLSMQKALDMGGRGGGGGGGRSPIPPGWAGGVPPLPPSQGRRSNHRYCVIGRCTSYSLPTPLSICTTIGCLKQFSGMCSQISSTGTL